MIWQNGWAWLGLLAIAAPVLIHLLGRGQARVHLFPTLRFLDPSRLLPTKRTRPHDLLLLAVRCAILAAAVTALAQPLFVGAHRPANAADVLVRAIVLDTSASMKRPAVSGGSAIDAARAEGRRLAAAAAASITIESSEPAIAMRAAAAWLARQSGRRELAVVSDFQPGAIDSAAIAAVPESFGVMLNRIAVRPDTGATERLSTVALSEVVARSTVAGGTTMTEWVRVSTFSAQGTAGVAILAGPAEQVNANAAQNAARVISVALPVDTALSIAIVYPSYPGRADLLASAKGLRSRTDAELAHRIGADSILMAAALHSITKNVSGAAGAITLVKNNTGLSVVLAASGTIDGRPRLLLFSLADAGTVTSAALIAAASRARSVAPPPSEQDPSALPENVLTSIQRPVPQKGTAVMNDTGATGPSDGRWLWVLALLLLALESWLRRTASPLAGAAHAS